jgi:hypothetical protein
MALNGKVAPGGIQLWQLAEALKQLREKSGMTCEDAGVALKAAVGGPWSRAKVSRIETRTYRPRRHELEQMLDVYGVIGAAERAAMLALQESSAQRGYWDAIRGDLPDDFHKVLDVEAALLEKRQVETMLIPGLLQTAEYVRALIADGNPSVTAERIERRVLARLARQQVLTKPNPLRLHAILDESILERPVGSPAIMCAQLQRLLDERRTKHVTIQILPKSVGASPAMNGPFSVMTPPKPMPDFGYVEAPGKAYYTDDRDAVRHYTVSFAILSERALSPTKSAKLITAAMRGYEQA